MVKRTTTKEFIEKAKNVHGDFYDYSEVEYINNSTKVKIICPIHGEFFQRPNDHLNGNGCTKCSISKPRPNQLTKENFIERAKKVHGNFYDYSQSEYISIHQKIQINCPEHGPFWQTPNSHIRGQGCPKCAISKQKINQSSTTEEFIQKAKEVHGNFYDYSEVEYIHRHKKVKIICPEHGPFQQTPGNHLKGKGCPECATIFWSPKYIKKYYPDKINNSCKFYIIECYSDNEQFIKIGITSKTVKERYQNNLNSYQYDTLYEYESTLLECSEIEQKLLKQFKDYQYFPQYNFNGSSECLTHDILGSIFQEIK